MRHQRRNTTTPQPSLETPALFRKTVKLAYYSIVGKQPACLIVRLADYKSAMRGVSGEANVLPPGRALHNPRGWRVSSDSHRIRWMPNVVEVRRLRTKEPKDSKPIRVWRCVN